MGIYGAQGGRRQSTDLVDLQREPVRALKESWRNYKPRGAFDEERTLLISVNRDMGEFKCFGCGVGGDAFKFVMLTEGMTYPEAIRKLAARVNITIEEARPEQVTAESREREALYRLMEEAARVYHRHLMESGDAKPGLDY